jgi:tetratricopeptide (TPR) repeat protein
VAGRAYAHARHRGLRDRPGFRTSPHYTQGLHYLASGQLSLAISELGKVAREDRDAVDVLQVLSHLQRETGQVERALQIHQGLLARADLTRAERAHALASLGADFRKAGFVDRATKAFEEALSFDPNNIYALMGQRKVFEDQGQWREAYDVQTRLASLLSIAGYALSKWLGVKFNSEMPPHRRAWALVLLIAWAELAPTVLSLDRRVFLRTRPPTSTRARALRAGGARGRATHHAGAGLPRLRPPGPRLRRSRRARAIRGDERAFDTPGSGRFPGRLSTATLAHDRARHEEAYGLLLRAVESNPQALVVHLEMLETLRGQGALGEAELAYLGAAQRAVFYADPHLCTSCRYRADGMLWRCPHCHEWNTFVEERLGPMVAR